MEPATEIDLLRAQAVKDRETIALQAKTIAAQAAKLEALEVLMQRLLEERARNSKNSNLPPSSDGPGASSKGAGKKPDKKGRKQGGQKGHKGSFRVLEDAEQVDEFVDMFPARCDDCHGTLPKTLDSSPKRHQHIELAPFAPHVTEYRRHKVCCPSCGHRTRAHYDDDVIPRHLFGPRVAAVTALLTGVYHLSRRRAASLLYEMLGLRISTGSISNLERRMSAAVKPAVEEAWAEAQGAKVKHTDGTTWLQAGVTLALWTLATAGVTVFKILDNGQGDTLERKLLTSSKGVLVSDRAAALKFWVMKFRQVCWAHLLRKFVAFTERDGPTRTLGRELLDCTRVVFAYWYDFKEGRLTREELAARIAPVRADFENTLRRAIDADIKGLSGSCSDMWEHREALWTFVDVEGVEPTNNHAERELRAFVLWRKRCFGAQSDRGHRFAERLMTIAHTARKQGRDVLAFLVACASRGDDEPAPSLFAMA